MGLQTVKAFLYTVSTNRTRKRNPSLPIVSQGIRSFLAHPNATVTISIQISIDFQQHRAHPMTSVDTVSALSKIGQVGYSAS